jgi:ABC-2 type transport system ATP-binding protein
MSKLYHVPAQQRVKKIDELLELFQLTEFKERKFAKLSKGQKRRVVLAAALIHSPEILFLDEPTSGLDIMSARRLRETISNLSTQGVTIFLTTHYIEEAGQLCNRIALLVKGKIIRIDTPEGLKNSVKDTPIVKARFTGLLDEESVKAIEGEKVSVINGEISILSNDVHTSIVSLLKVAEEKNLTIQNIETMKPRLEDAFIQLTGISLDSMRAEKEGKR